MRIESTAAPTRFQTFPHQSFFIFWSYQMQVHKDVVATVRAIHDLAARADQIGRAVEGHRVRRESGGPGFASSIERPHRTTSRRGPGDASFTAIAQLGQWCRDFSSVYATAFAALPDDLRKQIATI
jgi:hypothetical protein